MARQMTGQMGDPIVLFIQAMTDWLFVVVAKMRFALILWIIENEFLVFVGCRQFANRTVQMLAVLLKQQLIVEMLLTNDLAFVGQVNAILLIIVEVTLRYSIQVL